MRGALAAVFRSSLSALFVLGLVVSAALASHGGGVAGAPAADSPSASPPGLSLVSAPSAAAVPAHLGSPVRVLAGSVVNPKLLYSSEPAPMGIADFGVGEDGAAYAYNSTEFLGNFSWDSLAFQATTVFPSSDTNISVQLNVVLNFEDDGQNYSYWVQDVAFLDTANLLLSFEDNIWNLSSYSECMSSSAVSGNGSVGSVSGHSCVGYYYDGSDFSRFMSSPGTFSLLLRSYRGAEGRPEVAAEYRDESGGAFVTYDNILWPWATAVSDDQNFLVDGEQYTPSELFYDAELDVAGPGDASSSEALNPTSASTGLFYWNGHNFQAPRAAWNFGSDTGETSSNIRSSWNSSAAQSRGGTPVLLQENGTGAGATLGQAYNQSSIGYLNLSAPGIASGIVAVGPADWSFTGDEANLTLDPGSYAVWVNSSAGSVALGNCTVTAGAVTEVAVGTGCSATVSEPAAAPTSVDLGQNVSFTTSLQSAGGTSAVSYSWTVTPTGLGCAASTGTELNCTPTAAGTYNVSVTVRDAKGATEQSPTLRFVVHADPTLSVAATRSELDVGQSTTLTATPVGGSGDFEYRWSDLPDGCAGGSGPTLDCSPRLSGTAEVVVNATDSAGLSAQAGLTLTISNALGVPVVTVSPGSILEGRSVSFQVSASGGTPPYSYSYSGLPGGCTSVDAPQLNCTPTEVGSFGLEVEVTDVNGLSVNGTSELTVAPTFLGLPASEGYAVFALGFAVALAAAVAVAVVAYRRRPRRAPVAPSGAPMTAVGGTPPAASLPPAFCGACGTPVPSGALYCAGCGRPVTAPPSGPPGTVYGPP